MNGSLKASRLSVLVPHYGARGPTRELVARLLAQAPAAPREIIVVDDCTPDPLGAITGACVLRNKTNRGFGATVNAGAQMASGDALLILNTDLDFRADFVARLCEAAGPWWPAVLGPRIVNGMGKPDWTARHFPRPATIAAERLAVLGRWLETPVVRELIGCDARSAGTQTFPTDWLVGAALLLPTKEFRAVGGFDERFHMNSEEVDLQYRLALRGIPAVFVGDIEAVHEGGASTNNDVRQRWVMQGRNRYAAKWGFQRRMQLALTAASAVNLGHQSLRRVAGRPVRPLEAFRHELDLTWRTR